MVYLMAARSFDELEAVRRREIQLRMEVAERSVSDERSRIARDLHDSVGAQLAGLVSRVRGFASGTSRPLDPLDVASLERRVLDTIEEMRDVVLALRRAPMSWDEATELIGKRCREICGNIRFDLGVEGASSAATLRRVFPDLLRIVFELVRNAVRHGAPSSVEVRIEVTDGLRLRVVDDGRGFASSDGASSQGGLSNVRRRVENLGGFIDIASNGQGTRAELVLPGLQIAR
jgi:signal transduction histidine kinase